MYTYKLQWGGGGEHGSAPDAEGSMASALAAVEAGAVLTHWQRAERVALARVIRERVEKLPNLQDVYVHVETVDGPVFLTSRQYTRFVSVVWGAGEEVKR